MTSHSRTLFSLLSLFLLLGCSKKPTDYLPITIKQLENYELSIAKESNNANRPSFIEFKHNDSLFVANVFSKRNVKEYETFGKSVETNLYSLYHKLTTPYPGFISNKSGCLKKFHPIKLQKRNERELVTLYYTFANKNYSMGICDDKSITYRAIQGTVYCSEEKKYITFRWFYKLDTTLEIKQLLKTVRCNK